MPRTVRMICGSAGSVSIFSRRRLIYTVRVLSLTKSPGGVPDLLQQLRPGEDLSPVAQKHQQQPVFQRRDTSRPSRVTRPFSVSTITPPSGTSVFSLPYRRGTLRMRKTSSRAERAWRCSRRPPCPAPAPPALVAGGGEKSPADPGSGHRRTRRSRCPPPTAHPPAAARSRLLHQLPGPGLPPVAVSTEKPSLCKNADSDAVICASSSTSRIRSIRPSFPGVIHGIAPAVLDLALSGPAHELTGHLLHRPLPVQYLIDAPADGHLHAGLFHQLVHTGGGIVTLHHAAGLRQRLPPRTCPVPAGCPPGGSGSAWRCR